MIASHEYFGNQTVSKAGWDGYSSQSYSQGIVVKFPTEDGWPDYEHVIVGHYYYHS